MIARPTHAALERRALLVETLDKLVTLTLTVKDEGIDLNRSQHVDLLLLLEAVETCRESIGGNQR